MGSPSSAPSLRVLSWWVVGIDRALVRLRDLIITPSVLFPLFSREFGQTRLSFFLGLFFVPLVLGFDELLQKKKFFSLEQLSSICYVR